MSSLRKQRPNRCASLVDTGILSNNLLQEIIIAANGRLQSEISQLQAKKNPSSNLVCPQNDTSTGLRARWQEMDHILPDLSCIVCSELMETAYL